MNDAIKRGAGLHGKSFRRIIAPFSNYYIDLAQCFRHLSAALDQQPIVLRFSPNMPNERMVQQGYYSFISMARPAVDRRNCPNLQMVQYLHDGVLCFEPVYDDVYAEYIERFFAVAGQALRDHPNLMAVEGGGMGQYGEGTTWAYDKNKLLYPLDIQRRILKAQKEAFPNVPFVVRSLNGLYWDKTSVSVGGEFSEMIYEDALGHMNGTRNLFDAESHGGSCLGGEVLTSLQETMLKHDSTTDVFIEGIKSFGIKYLVFAAYKPANAEEQARLDRIEAALKENANG